MSPHSSRTKKNETNEKLMKRARFTFFFGLSLFGASLSWLIENIARLIYGNVPLHEALVPLTLLIVGSVLMVVYADIEILNGPF